MIAATILQGDIKDGGHKVVISLGEMENMSYMDGWIDVFHYSRLKLNSLYCVSEASIT